MCFPVERQHVMLAHRIEIDVLHDDHVAVFLMEQGFLKHSLRVLSVSFRKELHGLCHPQRCLFQPLPCRVFAKKSEDFLIVSGKFLKSRA